MEEYARFVLDDAALTETCKQLRHDLADAIRVLGDAAGVARPTSGPLPHGCDTGEKRGRGADQGDCELIGHRDVVGDVGREASTESEFRRRAAGDVARAAAARLTEGLRSLEEYGKVVDVEFARAIERIRYRAYDLERRLVLTGRAGEKFAGVRLYVILTEALCRHDWFATAEAVLEGGADAIQLREKSLPDRELFARAVRLAQLCRRRERVFIVNDRPDVAAAGGAHGVHLGQDDLSVSAARRVVPASAVIGLSTHTVEQLETAIAVCPDYVAVGPVFATATKPQDHVAGLLTLAYARRRTSLPLVAIGGIEADNLRAVVGAVACTVCVCSSVISEPDPRASAARLRAIIEASRTAMPENASPVAR